MTSKFRRKGSLPVVVLAVILAAILELFIAETPAVYGQTCGNVTFDQWISGQTTSTIKENQYTFYGVRGSRVSIWMEQGDYSSIDPYLQLADPYGTIVTYNDDSAGTSNSFIDGYLLQSTGCYTIIAGSYGNYSYGAYWLYVLLN